MRHRPFARLAAGLVLGTLLAACASLSGTGPARLSDGVYVGPNGMTLYTFDRDTTGKSNCNGPCAANWPPLMASAGDAPSGDWSVITREDGSRQWAFQGKPVYYWARDARPGDRTGDGVNNAWRLVRP